MSERQPIRRALVSVYDKSGLDQLAKALIDAQVEVVSTGSTAKELASHGVTVTEVSEITGFPECLDGRVKTLHPKVHAGILADRRLTSHREQLTALEVKPFDLVVCNLYPFAETVAQGGDFDECIEKIDIGGPSMVRAAAKNHANVAVLTNPDQYEDLARALSEGGYTVEERRVLAARAFAHTAAYDVAVATWFGSRDGVAVDGVPTFVGTTGELSHPLRYGENSHQAAAVYRSSGEPGLAGARQLHGKAMSYNNYVDTNSARRAALRLRGALRGRHQALQPVRYRHRCPTLPRRIARHMPATPLSGLRWCHRHQPPGERRDGQPGQAEIFTEVVVAPGYEDGAVEILSRKKNIRLLECPAPHLAGWELRQIDGGLLAMETDLFQADGDDPANWTLAAGDPVDDVTLADLSFAWRACRSVKSNAILLAHDGASVGVGMGQVNRVDSCRLAVERAGDRAAGSVAASDAFFPFADGPQVLIDAHIAAIVEPGGSIRDDQTIEVCRTAGVPLYFTGTRHFFH